MSEFAGTPLAVGEVYGARQWEVDSLGRLTGVSFRSVWRPGENVAECRRTRTTTKCMKGECGNYHSPPTSFAGMSFSVGSATCTEPDPCGGIDPKCGCGFWAYYDDAQWHAGTVKGVIKGYGVTTIGTKGFRCEKAEVVALCIPRADTSAPPADDDECDACDDDCACDEDACENPGASRWDRFGDWMHTHDYGFLAATAGPGGVAGGLAMAAATHDWRLGFLAVLMVLLAGGVYRAQWRGWKRSQSRRDSSLNVSAAMFSAGTLEAAPSEQVALVRRNYPDVAFFDDYAAMLAAYPLTEAERPTPDDPAFWDVPAGASLPPRRLRGEVTS